MKDPLEYFAGSLSCDESPNTNCAGGFDSKGGRSRTSRWNRKAKVGSRDRSFPCRNIPSRPLDSMNLVMVARRREPHVLRDFREVAAICRHIAPDIRPIAIFDAPSSQLRYSFFLRPTLIFALRRLLFYHPFNGALRSSKLLPKSEEYRRLQGIGIRVPRWRLLTRRHSPAVADLGRYVVSKPDYGGLGADVRIRRAGRVRWAPSNTPVRFASRSAIIAQEFIYTGPWPVSYRVSTLFGRALYSQRAEGSHQRRPILGPESFTTSSVTATHQGCSFALDNDREVIELAERAHAAFPDIAFLGVDILREMPSGRLFVLEVNSAGADWHFSSLRGTAIQAFAGIDYASQFGGLQRVAEILIEETRRLAG